ncbi:DoxX family protein [Runella sp.]|uniref:DoxX family protein n=1 Tax=Runella sp. TaxID=1960881 RepID=UPI003D0C3C1C
MNTHSFLILRLAAAASMFGHGLVRVPKLPGFSAWMLSNFEKSMLPTALVTPFSYALPVLELVTGILLLLGLFTRQALYLGALIMLILIFGSCMIEKWDWLPSQLLHTGLFALLLNFIHNNTFALDNLVKHT